MQKHDRPSGADPNRAVAPARACAYAVVRRVFEQDAWADRALHGEAQRLRLDARDLALATQLTFGTVQRVATLDHVIATLARPAGREARPAGAGRAAARRLPADVPGPRARARRRRRVGRAGQGRRAARRRPRQRRPAPRRRARRARSSHALPDRTPAQAALAHSHPEWIADLWFDALGAADARALMAADNEPAEAVLRANTLKIAPERARRPPARPDAAPTASADPRRALRRLRLARVGGRAC